MTTATRPTFAIGNRVRIIEVTPDWDVTHHRLGTEGIVFRIDTPRQDAPVQVRFADGEEWAFAPLSLKLVQP